MLIVTRFQLCIYSTVNRIKKFLVQSPLFLAFVPILFFLEVCFVIDKLSKELEQIDPYYVNRLMTKGVITDINCKPFGELKIVLLLCSEVLLRVSVLIFLVDILLRLLFEDPLARLVVSLLDIC